MKKKTIGIFLTSLFAVGILTGCNQEEAAATYVDMTAESIFGHLSDFKVDALKSGHTLTFTANPAKYYTVKENGVTNNGVACKLVKNNPDGSQVFKTTLKAGENRLMGTYDIKSTVDIVAEYKLPVSGDVFNEVIGYTGRKQKYGLDFRRAGIEQMKAPLKWSGSGASATKADSGAFINYVDGDTTHIETANLGYTVKIRYLSINTPESTSEIEEWGLTASNYNKFLFSGDEHYLEKFEEADREALLQRPHGATSVILISSAVAKEETIVDEEIIDDDDDDDLVNPAIMRADDSEEEKESEHRPIEVKDLMIDVESDEKGPFHAGVDGYGRSLCYVWYATVQNPTLDDFRCLNLEMVYQGLSLGIGSRDATSLETYKMFAAADNSAKANHRHIHSGKTDPLYYYYQTSEVLPLSLNVLYKSALLPNGGDADPKVKYNPDRSPYADKKTLYRIEGYVTEKVGEAFYIQDNYQYDNDKVVSGEITPYGIYVFTLRSMPIQVGQYVSVVGAISTYSGTFQMQGISYHLRPDLNRDTLLGYRYNYATKQREKVRYTYTDEEGVEHETDIFPIKPIQLTGAQFNSLKLQSVLVEIVEDVHFYDFQEKFSGHYQPIAMGGTEEVDTNNESYPFYYTNNNPYVWAKYGNETTQSLDIYNTTNRDGDLRYSDELIRIVVNKEVLLSDEKGNVCQSYRFLTGGTYYYNNHGAEYANLDPDNPYLDETQTKTFKRKSVLYKDHGDGYGLHGLVVISHAYKSTSGNTKMSAEICSSSWDEVRLTTMD